jgi:hypothetical protein
MVRSSGGRATMDQQTKEVTVSLIAANGVYAGLAIGLFGLNEALLPLIVSHPAASVAGALVLEGVTLAAIWGLHRRKEQPPSDQTPFNAGLDEVVVRYASADDAEATEAIYREWFSDALSIDDAEFAKVVSRSLHVRVAEEVYSSGASQVVGYYSIWPMSLESYRSMVNGEIKESQFTSSMILAPNAKSANVVYVSEICVRKGSTAGSILLKDAMSYVSAIARKNTKVTCVAAWGSTPIGRSIATRMGMTRVRKKSGKLTEFYEIGRSDAFKVLAKAPTFRPLWRISFN